jgi:DNA-binding transcriptional regulator YiaG
MKNITSKKKKHHEPSEKSRWAYWMQAIEPISEAINKAFPDYHPQWLQMSQMYAISPAMFICSRQMLGMTREQCAAFLRVGISTVTAWERGSRPVSFACFELLRVIHESVSFKMSHTEWDGWFISAKGVLVSPNYNGKGFTPERLDWLEYNCSEASLLRNEVALLKENLDTAIAENTTLRQMFLNNGVIDELALMQDKINGLMDRIGTAQVIPFLSTSNNQLQELAA